MNINLGNAKFYMLVLFFFVMSGWFAYDFIQKDYILSEDETVVVQVELDNLWKTIMLSGGGSGAWSFSVKDHTASFIIPKSFHSGFYSTRMGNHAAEGSKMEVRIAKSDESLLETETQIQAIGITEGDLVYLNAEEVYESQKGSRQYALYYIFGFLACGIVSLFLVVKFFS